MYSTCLFCHGDLGANVAIEHFPVGRRLAFDASKGRLWVVCRKCERWNLTPLEERWEAIEECERSFRDTRLRVATDEIGLARLTEGLELIRIGKPLRPEFAAWRYGDQFGRRRRKNIVRTGVVVAAAATVPFLGPAFGITLGGAGVYGMQLANFGGAFYRSRRVIARVPDDNGTPLSIRMSEAERTVILGPTRDAPWGLRVTHRASRDRAARWWNYVKDQDTTEVHGETAIRIAGHLLPRLNRASAPARKVKAAVAFATKYEAQSRVFEEAARIAASRRNWNDFSKEPFLKNLPAEMRLALEMVSHEESERRAMDGELALLESAWKEAEEIAAISDDMFLPEEVSQRLAELKKR
jgi:hypothetical protein